MSIQWNFDCCYYLYIIALGVDWLSHLVGLLERETARYVLRFGVLWSVDLFLLELRLYKKREKRNVRSLSQHYLHTAPFPATANYPKSSKIHTEPDGSCPSSADRFCSFDVYTCVCSVGRIDHNGHPLPLDVTDYKVSLLIEKSPFRPSPNRFVSSSLAHFLSVNLKHQAPMVITITPIGCTVPHHRFVRSMQSTYVVDFRRSTDLYRCHAESRELKWSISSC